MELQLLNNPFIIALLHVFNNVANNLKTLETI